MANGNTTATDPTGTPVSSQTTSVYNPLAPAPTATGTSTSMKVSDLVKQLVDTQATDPTIWIATALPATSFTGVIIQFEYMPDSVSFGISADFTPQAIKFTSARWLVYDHSDIEEVSLTIKVVAGCNNCITRFGGSIKSSNYLNAGPLVTGRYQRNTLITIAKALYSLPLPSNNNFYKSDNSAMPPPTCRLIVGKMFSGIGAFTRCQIQFNGPWDWDGSPTDMDVTLGFLPSEFYDSAGGEGAESHFAKPFDEGKLLEPENSPTGESELTGDIPYAISFGETTKTPGATGLYDVPKTPAQVEKEKKQPQQQLPPSELPGGALQPRPTYSDLEVANAFGVEPKDVFHKMDGSYIIIGSKFNTTTTQQWTKEAVNLKVAQYQASRFD